jgi:hypothetical protein
MPKTAGSFMPKNDTTGIIAAPKATVAELAAANKVSYFKHQFRELPPSLFVPTSSAASVMGRWVFYLPTPTSESLKCWC